MIKFYFFILPFLAFWLDFWGEKPKVFTLLTDRPQSNPLSIPSDSYPTPIR
jgi:hypothetical protein